MKKKLLKFLILIFGIFLWNEKVLAACSLEDQVTANNAAGAINVIADKLKYTYNDYDENEDAYVDVDAYTGIIYVYNLTEDIYFKITDGTTVETYTYADDVGGAVAVSTGSMDVVKNYTISIFNTNNACSNTPIRTITATLPRYNVFANYLSCREYPDYYYCQQFLTTDAITEDQFMVGIDSYAKTHKTEEEKRKEGIIENTIKIFKKYWYILVITIIIIGCIILGVKKYVADKRKKEIV